jgi:hypothetical protein
MHRFVLGLGAAAAILAVGAALIALCGTLHDLAARMWFNENSNALSTALRSIAGTMLLAALVPGIPYLAAAGFARDPGTGIHVQRTPLAVFPGILVALFLAAAGLALAAAHDLPARDLASELAAGMREAALLGLLPFILLAGLAGGGRPPRRASIAAAPAVIAWSIAFTGALPIVKLFAGLAVPMAILAVPFLIGLAFAAAAMAPWLTGIGLFLCMCLLMNAGRFTPSEAGAIVAGLGIVIALPLRLAFAGGILPLLRIVGGEMVAVLAGILAASIVNFAIGAASADRLVAGTIEALAPALAIGIGAIVVLFLATLLTPLAALPVVPLLIVGMQTTTVEQMADGAAICLAAFAGLLIRSTAWQDDGTGHKAGLESGKLPRALGWPAILLALTLVAMAVLAPKFLVLLSRLLD